VSVDRTHIIKMPDSCVECVFNYDGLECRIFKEEYREAYDTFDPYNERPKFCQFVEVKVEFVDGKKESP